MAISQTLGPTTIVTTQEVLSEVLTYFCALPSCSEWQASSPPEVIGLRIHGDMLNHQARCGRDSL